MEYGTPRAPLSERLRRSAQNPFVAALLGGFVVLIAVLILAVAGVFGGGDKTTIVQQTPIPQPSVADAKSGSGLSVHQIYVKDGPGVAFVRAEVVQRTQS